MHDMFSGVALSTKNYDGLLMRVGETSPHDNLILDAGDSTYSAAAVEARTALSDKGWHIIDAGMAQSDPADKTEGDENSPEDSEGNDDGSEGNNDDGNG